jgi:Mandelate racemase / muconate lactonizing enzyme, N-terminal domain
LSLFQRSLIHETPDISQISLSYHGRSRNQRTPRIRQPSEDEDYEGKGLSATKSNPLFNQSDMVVTIETDAGITGVGEGGSKDLLEQAAGRLIGKDPQFIELLWQDMNRAFFYPAAVKGLMPLERSISRCGTSKAKFKSFQYMSCLVEWCAIIASATTRQELFPA